MMFWRCPCCDKSLSEYERFNFEDNDGWCNECISISAQDVREWEETYVPKEKEDENTNQRNKGFYIDTKPG